MTLARDDATKLTRTSGRSSPPPRDWLDLENLNLSLPLADQAFGLLRRAIVAGHIGSGFALNEQAIAAHFGWSRTPIREALLRLKRDGLISIRPQSGTFVAPIDPKRVEEGMIVREALEPRAAIIAAERIDRRALSLLSTETDLMAEALVRNDANGFILADDRFHRTLIDASGFSHIAEIIEQVNGHLDRVRIQIFRAPPRPKMAIREHRVILSRLKARDGEGCAAALFKHLEASWKTVRRAQSERH